MPWYLHDDQFKWIITAKQDGNIESGARVLDPPDIMS